jgi:hypothetical protein
MTDELDEIKKDMYSEKQEDGTILYRIDGDETKGVLQDGVRKFEIKDVTFNGEELSHYATGYLKTQKALKIEMLKKGIKYLPKMLLKITGAPSDYNVSKPHVHRWLETGRLMYDRNLEVEEKLGIDMTVWKDLCINLFGATAVIMQADNAYLSRERDLRRIIIMQHERDKAIYGGDYIDREDEILEAEQAWYGKVIELNTHVKQAHKGKVNVKIKNGEVTGATCRKCAALFRQRDKLQARHDKLQAAFYNVVHKIEVNNHG